MSVDLKPGDKVYRVELDVAHPDSGRGDTWVVDSREVVSVGAKIRFDKQFRCSFRLMWSHNALGAYFHKTPAAAVKFFIESEKEKLESHKRQIAECEMALAWADRWKP